MVKRYNILPKGIAYTDILIVFIMLIILVYLFIKNFSKENYDSINMANTYPFVHKVNNTNNTRLINNNTPQAGNPYARCSMECQTPQHKLGPDYPVLPPDPNYCNPATKAYLELSPPESIANTTREINGKRYQCSKSCPQAEVACGLNDGDLYFGVM